MKYLKIIIFSFFILFYLQSVVAQNSYVTCVTYKVDRYTAIGEKDIHNNEILNAFRTLEYQLVYNKTKSMYQPVQKLSEVETDVHYKIAQMIAGSFFYKDTETKEKFEQSEIDNEPFLVIKNFDEYNWEISKETKIIDGYECYKATCNKEIFSELRNLTTKFTPTVWFAPAIPAPFGPYGLDGLPGLVLEGTLNGKIYFYATKINVNCESKLKLEKPTKIKYLTEKEFSEISVKKTRDNLNQRQ